MRVNKYHYRQPGKDIEFVRSFELTEGLCKEIATYNGNLTPEQVRHYIELGSSVYTNFYFYCKVREMVA